MAALAMGAAPPSCPGLFRHSIESSCDFDSATCRPVKAWVRSHGRDPRVSNRIVIQMVRTPAARSTNLGRVLRRIVHDPFERPLADWYRHVHACGRTRILDLRTRTHRQRATQTTMLQLRQSGAAARTLSARPEAPRILGTAIERSCRAFSASRS